jgi:hypothetical protein
MAMSLGLGLWLSSGGSSGPVTIPAPFASVNGPTSDPYGGAKYEGWSANYSAQPTVPSPVAFTVSRPGYSGTDSSSADTTATTTYLDTMYVTTTVRQPWPNQTSQSALTAALSEYIYSTDTPSGSVTNNCTLTSPKPVAKWALPGRRVVGNSVRLEVVAFHRDARNGKPVSHVVFTATDGTNTVTATVATPAILAYTNDQNPVIGYGVDLDITSLNDNASFTVDAVVYPWIGNSTASQRRSVDGTSGQLWEFSTQTYLKNTSRAASPPFAYITAAGNDGTGVVSTTAATAKATPFATLKGALEGLKAQVTTTDGCQVRISNHTVAWGPTASAAGTYQTVGEVIITRDPDVARASCVLSFGGSTVSHRHSWMRFTDLTIDRAGGTSQPNFVNPAQVTFDNCDFNNSSRASQIIANATSVTHWIGIAFTNATTQILSAGTTPVGIIRGCTGSGLQVETCCVIGNTLTGNLGSVSTTATRSSNAVLAFNKFQALGGATVPFGWGNLDATGVAIVQNLFEYTSATGNAVVRPSGDDATGNLTHFVIHNNTFAGAGVNGRLNMFYDETDFVRRNHTLVSFKGNVCGSGYYIKADWFHGASDGNPEGYTIGSPSQAIGNWSIYYGAGCVANFSNYATASPDTEAQVYAGDNSLIGTSTSTPQVTNGTGLSSLFTNNQAVTFDGVVTYTAGAGSGGYLLADNVANVARGIMESRLLPFTLDGVARLTASDHPGAFSAA